MTRNITIWQLPITNKLCFRPVNYNSVDIRNYVLVYSFEEDVDEKDINAYLEELYGRFNINEPADYHARSMSISDLILYRNTEKNEYVGYVVDLTGFKKIKVTGLS